MKNIFVFVGEFSYELNWYVPWLRKACKTTYANDYNIFYGRPKMERLYQDFISEYRIIPQDILNQFKYPCTIGERVTVNDKFLSVTPYILIKYLTEMNLDCSVILPPLFNTRLELPNGEYINYNPSIESNSLIKDFLHKINVQKENTVLVMPKVRNRSDKLELQNWQKEKWEEYVNLLINNLKYNVISLFFEEKNSSGGSYKLNINNPKYFTIINPSLDQQLALLKNTKYSIYGSTGANSLPFFSKTPMITYVLDCYGRRLNYEWQKKLTNNHEKQKIVLVENMSTYTVEQAYNELIDFENKIKYN